MAGSSLKRFPLYAKEYELFEEVGEGVSATVYRARCIALNENVAIKIMDLEKCRNDLETIRKEVHIMSLIDHPNLLKAHCSFIDRSCLWIVMPYMSGGSCFHLMKSVYPEGLEQPIIATLLREVLKALVYLHRQGHIHRDVKAGNILIHSKGVVKLGDFGVSACMFDSGERMRTRNTFVGTPCWMAPEVMQQVDGYDFKADIWSFGITALELAHGHAPFSKYPPMKVLLMTLQNAPPRLDYDRDKKFSKSFRDLIAACLVKDPKKRPTSAKLLKHPFFKHARSTDYLSRKILHGLSPLGDRFRKLKDAEAELFKGINGDKEQLSQQEYMRGISGWNFDLEELRKQASVNPDDEMCSSEIREVNGNGDNGLGVPKRNPMTRRSKTMSLENFKISEKDMMMSASNSLLPGALLPSFHRSFHPMVQRSKTMSLESFKISEKDVMSVSGSLLAGALLPSFQRNFHPMVQHSKTMSLERFKISDKDVMNASDSLLAGALLPSFQRNFLPRIGYQVTRSDESNACCWNEGAAETISLEEPKELEPLVDTKEMREAGSEPVICSDESKACFSIEGASEMLALEEPKEIEPLADTKERRKAGCEPEKPINGNTVRPVNRWSCTATEILPMLESLLVQNDIQRETVVRLINFFGRAAESENPISNPEGAQIYPSRERELQSQVQFLEQSVEILVEEVKRSKETNSQLERQIISLTSSNNSIT